MADYVVPLLEMSHVLQDIAGVGAMAKLPGFEEVNDELVEAILEECGKLASGAIAPLNASADREGSRVENGQVVEASGLKEAYREYVEGGWNSLPYDPEFGGQGLPGVLASAVLEMVQTANLAFSLCPMLTQGATDAIAAHGSDELKQKYLSNMISGEWTGTMNLTESPIRTSHETLSVHAHADMHSSRIFRIGASPYSGVAFSRYKAFSAPGNFGKSCPNHFL